MEEVLKTSKEWYEEMPKELGFVIYDPDGWDRQNYQFSFFEEKITKQEFIKRTYSSTVLSDGNVKYFFDNWVK